MLRCVQLEFLLAAEAVSFHFLTPPGICFEGLATVRLCRLLRERSGGEPRGSDSYSDLSHVPDVSDLPVDLGTYDDARRYWYTSKLAAHILVSPYSLVLSSAIHRGQGPFLKMDSALVPSIHQLWPTQTF